MNRKTTVGAPMLALMLLIGLCTISRAIEADSGSAGFAVSLVQSGEVILSDDHIAAYKPDSFRFVLSPRGIDRWDSFVPRDHSFDPPIPKLSHDPRARPEIAEYFREEGKLRESQSTPSD